MKSLVWTAGLILALSGLAMAAEEAGIAETDMGLSKTSPFDVPEQEAFSYPEGMPENPTVPGRQEPGTPPMIPHGIADLLPLTAGQNACLDCHDQPDLIGQAAEGDPTPMPESHYRNLWTEGEARKIDGSRFVCTQCHAPQAKVKPLVENTF